MQDTEWRWPTARCLFAQKLGPNLSEMEVRTFVSRQKVIWDQLLAFRALTNEKKAFFGLFVTVLFVVTNRINYRLWSLSLVCFWFRSLLLPVEIIFSSKSLKKSSKKIFPFNFELSGNNSSFFWPNCPLVLCLCFSVALGDCCVLSWVSKVKRGHK